LTKELIINAAPQGVEIALMEDKKLVELHNEKADANFAVGDLYLGKVKKLIPGLNAAFVDVGFEKDAFLHYTDLSPYIRSILKFTNITIADKSETGFDFGKFTVEPEIVKSILEKFCKFLPVPIFFIHEDAEKKDKEEEPRETAVANG